MFHDEASEEVEICTIAKVKEETTELSVDHLKADESLTQVELSEINGSNLD